MEETNWITEFLQARAWGLVDGLIYTFVYLVLSAVAGWLSRATIVSRYALRTRIGVGIIFVTGLAFAAVVFGVPAKWVILTSGLATIVFITVALRGLTNLGISNAFVRTSEGISPERSLQIVKKELVFLGIGASKLTGSKEYPRALERCKKEGRTARFLLSDPNNPELTRLAGQNNKNDTAYRSRVEQSIREIFHHGNSVGVNFEVRLYEMDNEKSLSKFRMMFIDDQICLLSHVVWNENEGSDNSQIIISQPRSVREQGLFHAYKDFFEDLWISNSSRKITSEMIERGLVS